MIDLHAIAPQHVAIDGRLRNWGRYWRDKGGANVHPMFRHYRPDNYEREVSGDPVDVLDAVAMQKVYAQLPKKHMHALSWCYIYPWVRVSNVCKLLAVSGRGLADLLFEARCMVVNRER